MKQTLEKLWNEYLSDQCAAVDTDEEREGARRAVELHEEVSALLSKHQEEALEKYVDTLLELEGLFVKKAFFKGCEFAVSFFLEAVNLQNRK